MGTEPHIPESNGAAPLPANYRWWQEHGPTWVERYEAVKQQGPKYHVSEFIVCEYVAQHAPARVLEFGCGSGRHLRYLRTIPGVDVHGCDQSATMLAGVARWAEPEWMERRVRLGPPLGRLPYGDGTFDLVYTASVLVHVRPEDLGAVLGEIARVSRGHVLHLENRVGWAAPHRPDHEGCWTHDLPAAYRSLGWRCEDLSGGSPTPALFRALAPGVEAGYAPSAALLGLYERMVRDLCGPR